MKTVLQSARNWMLTALVWSWCFAINAEIFTGTNMPSMSTELPVVVDAGTTNLSLILPGNLSGYSHIWIKKGSHPTDVSYDFSSQLNAQTNALHLEQPELTAGTYYVRVRTPLTSPTHAFTLRVDRNSADMRSTNRPPSKPLNSLATGLAGNGSRHFFRVELTANTAWQIRLTATNHTVPDVYVQRGLIPGEYSWLKSSVNVTNDYLSFSPSEGTAGVYYIGVIAPANSTARSYALRMLPNEPVNLVWDDGATFRGTQVHTNLAGAAGDYYFRMVTGNPSVGAWRTALRVLEGEAHLYLRRGGWPTLLQYDFRSERVGSDGVILAATQFIANEEWFIMVKASDGAKWTIVSGAPYVQELGVVAKDEASASGEVEIGPEGIRFFSATAPADMLAWRLWLQTTNFMTNAILLKKGGVPLPLAKMFEIQQPGQMLVVPPYLAAGQQYFIGVVGRPNELIRLDCRQQPILNLAYDSSTAMNISGYGYVTFKVDVPVDQYAWQLSLPASKGNPNLAVRRNLVPNESDNDAYSELSTNVDNISLVPPMTTGDRGLSDGAYYVTVYGLTNYQFTLYNEKATITPLNYLDARQNEETNRVGWRYYKVSNLTQQMNTLGWDLLLSGFAPGTRIALRRNAAPSLWDYRMEGKNTPVKNYEVLSTAEYLQRPGHQADVWYIGVYNPSNVLGKFTLTAKELQCHDLADQTPLTRTNTPGGRWEFFKMVVPNDPAILGWDLRLVNVTSGIPRLVVARDMLPYEVKTTVSATAANWPSYKAWAPDADWTDRTLSANNQRSEEGHILAMGMGAPLEPGTYYVGVLNTTNAPGAYTLLSRWIGFNQAIPVRDLAWDSGKVTATAAPREAMYYRAIIPPGQPSWKVRLTPQGASEAMLLVTADRIPNIATMVKRMQKTGKEHFVRLPGTDNPLMIAPGTNYLAVVAEGQSPMSANHIGLGDTTFTLETLGPLAEKQLGLLTADELVVNNTLDGGEVAAYHFYTRRPDTLGFWILLENVTGSPTAVSIPEEFLPNPGATSDTYGNAGGQPGGAVFNYMLTVTDPASIETITVKARGGLPNIPDASYTMRIREIVPEPLAFDHAGGVVVEGHSSKMAKFYAVDVPADALGWDLRLVNVSSGSPRLWVAKNSLIGLKSGGLAKSKTWKNDTAWWAGSDWTGRDYSATDSTYEADRILMMSKGRPLEPGRYYVCVYSLEENASMSFTLLSRGIGSQYSIPVTDLAYQGGEVTQDLMPREAAYFRVNIPANAPSWKVRLTAISGESLLIALKDSLPNIGANGSDSVVADTTAGRKMQKLDDEHFILLPKPGERYLTPGYYYLGVVGEGYAPMYDWTIGNGPSTFNLATLGAAPVRQVTVPPDQDLIITNALAGGDVEFYQIGFAPGVLSLVAQLENVVGSPVMVMRAGINPPDPGISAGTGVPLEKYGHDGGEITTNYAHASLLTVANPLNMPYTLAIKARGLTNASYTLRLSASGTEQVTFDRGTNVVTDQGPRTWRFFRVTVPPEVMGWDIRLANVISGSPRLVIRRDSVPSGPATTTSWTPQSATTWPANAQWAADKDWTLRTYSANSLVDESGRILAMGMGRPLQPGNYYIGITNANTTNNASYTLISRGIGDGFAIPVVELPAGTTMTNVDLAPREAAYYRVVVPSNTPSWKVWLRRHELGGESMLAVMRHTLPNVKTVAQNGGLTAGQGMQQPGNENFVYLPGPGLTQLPPGTNYLAVIGEGINPGPATGSKPHIGTGTSAYVLRNEGELPIIDLGLLTSANIETVGTLDEGEVAAYRFTVPAGTYGIKLRLDNRAGNPVMVVLATNQPPSPGAAVGGLAVDAYGNDGGYASTNGHASLVTLANAQAGVYTVMVKARALDAGPSSASYTLRVQEILAPEQNFSSEWNSLNGLSHVVTGELENNERAFYKFYIPATNAQGQPIIGWKLDLAGSGQSWMRVQRAVLPSDANGKDQMPFTRASAIIAPPFLREGTWFVEVKGSNSAAFTLTSQPLTLEREPWVMPPPGTDNQLPGLPWHVFGSTTIATNGVPLRDDKGTDLPLGAWHYYALDVPDENLGVLRVQLDAINANPNLYLRMGDIPTLFHNADGAPGTIYHRAMLVATNSEIGNFVPLNGTDEARLQPGRYFLAVHAAGNANARYRLMVSSGDITEMPLHGAARTGQELLGGDWRYYRVQVPPTVPFSFNVSFSSELPGSNYRVYLRDTVPPGNGTNATDVRDWSTDKKNSTTLASYDKPGTYSFAVPPVRPGHVYYVGVRALTLSTFTLGITTNGVAGEEPKAIPFYGGLERFTLPPFEQAIYRIDVPAEATRWKHSAIHHTNVMFFLEQGTLPTKSSSDEWRSAGPNTSLNKPLVVWNNELKEYNPAAWPWRGGQPYYLLVSNATDRAQDVTLNLDGRNLQTEDEDGDQLLDVWELLYFSNITSQSATNDFDHDGVRNIEEQLDETSPTDPASFFCRLTLQMANGELQISPAMERYPIGASVRLTPVPDAGYAFVGWEGDAEGLASPLELIMDTPKNITAKFKLAGDEFITALPLSGSAGVVNGMNVSMTKEPGEPYHAGNPGGKSIWWRWIAPSTGNTTFSTKGSAFKTLLGVYTGLDVASLAKVASDCNSLGGTNRSFVQFNAVAGTVYYIAVDGYDGASSHITLSYTNAGGTVIPNPPPRFEPVECLADGTARLRLTGAPNVAYLIEASTDLRSWKALPPVITAPNGTAIVNDAGAKGLVLRFYRAREQ